MKTSKLFYLASKVDSFLKKEAMGYPSAETITPIVEAVVENNSGNSLLKSVVEVVKPITVTVNVMDARCQVYFQLAVEPKDYNRMMDEPERSQVSDLLKPAIEQALQTRFKSYEFKVKIGIVPEM